MSDTITTTTTIDSDNNEIPNDSTSIRSKKRLQKSTSLQPSMRHNNNNDMELAAEIGQGLLSEVRKMHSLLHQKQDSLMTLEHEKVEQEHQIDALTKQLKQKTDREGTHISINICLITVCKKKGVLPLFSFQHQYTNNNVSVYVCIYARIRIYMCVWVCMYI